jgi:DNA-directed RNA polymerase subunit RPC12/RpoP
MKIQFNKKCGNSAEKYDYKYDDFDPEEEIECTSCGARFKKNLMKCPYCASTNLIGAEKSYMDKITGIEDTMADLKKEDIKAVKEESKEIWHMLRPFIIIVIIIAAIAVIVTVRNNISKS